MYKVKFLIAAALIAGSSFLCKAQDPDECLLYLSYYQEYYKQGTRDAKLAAIPSWRKAYSICAPNVRQNLYIHGADLCRILISQNAKNPEYKAALVDTLITLHMKRAQYYPKYANKAYAALSADVNNYLKNDPVKTHDILAKVIELNGSASSPVTFLASMNAAVSLYKDGKLTAEDIINEYENSSACFDELQKVDTTQNTRNLRTTFENAFINSNVATCENLIALFGPRFEESKNDISMVTKIAKLMTSSDDCTDNELFLNVVTQMHNLEPSANSAYYLYRLYSSKGESAKAMAYLEEAAASEDLEPEVKGKYNYELAAFSLKNGAYAKCVSAANKALSLDPSYSGKCYMLIAQVWMSIVCGGNEIERRAKYWVAVDYLNKAKAADSELAEDAAAQISQCTTYFPQSSEAFMYDITNGQSYTVSCNGMKATTIVRTN